MKVTEKLKKFAISFMGLFAIAACLCLSSCNNDDEPVEGDDIDYDNVPVVISNIKDLEGEWMLVREILYWSQVDPESEDKTYDYSGNEASYIYYKVSVDTESGKVTWQQVSATGTNMYDPKSYYMDGNKLLNAQGELAGQFVSYDLKHGWNNLQILWNTHEGPSGADAPVLSSYTFVKK